METKTAEEIKLNILIDAGRGVLFSLSQREIIFKAMEEYAAHIPKSAPPDDIKNFIEEAWDEFLEKGMDFTGFACFQSGASAMYNLLSPQLENATESCKKYLNEIESQQKEIERLKEYEWKYKELCK